MDSFDVRNPATGEVLASITRDSVEEINDKLVAGEHAFHDWKKRCVYERAELLDKWAALILYEKESIAELMTKENGKPLRESLGEINYAVSYITWYAEEAKRNYGRTIPSDNPGKWLVTSKQPVGLVAAITPWNFPAAMMTRKAAPALAAGCTFVVKAAEEAPLTTIRLVELAHLAGIPEAVLQNINARGKVVGDIFTDSKLVKKITFTGSTAVGKKLLAKSAQTVKNVTMELGGHAPLIVAADADLDFAVKQTMLSKFRNSGQTCVCVNRILVHESVYDSFTAKFVEQVEKLVIGNGLLATTNIGPVINRASYEKISAQIEDARKKGATVLVGNKFDVDEQVDTYFVHPTVLGGVTTDMHIMQEETFGPVVPITTFTTIDEAINIANSTPYGLAAYFFTNDYRVGHYLFEQLDFGIIGWNDGAPSAAHIPFGGLKESGLGREGGSEGIESYLETKILSVGNHF